MNEKANAIMLAHRFETMKEWIEFAGALDAETATVSPPQFGADLVMSGYSHDDMVNSFIDALKQSVDTTERNKVVLAFELEPQMMLNGGFRSLPQRCDECPYHAFGSSEGQHFPLGIAFP